MGRRPYWCPFCLVHHSFSWGRTTGMDHQVAKQVTNKKAACFVIISKQAV